MDAMLQPREQPRKLDFPPEGEKIARSGNDTINVFYELKRELPDVYRHILGIAKAFLKKP